jgi:hypothetical protein|tara:strand:+ start:164 stop:457 length:294 start_codon:yes stop_codon:yes gene_type:complete
MKIRDVTSKAPVYSTKYALTSGIQTFKEGQIERMNGHLWYTGEHPHFTPLRLKREAWEERGAAEADAKRKALRRIESLKEQLRRLADLADWPKWEVE